MYYPFNILVPSQVVADRGAHQASDGDEGPEVDRGEGQDGQNVPQVPKQIFALNRSYVNSSSSGGTHFKIIYKNNVCLVKFNCYI